MRRGRRATSELAAVDRPLVEERHHPLRPWVVAGLLGIAILAVALAFYATPLRGGPLGCAEPAELVPAPESEDGVVGPPRCVLSSGAEPIDVVLTAELTNAGRLPVDVEGLNLGETLSQLVEVVDLRAGGASAPFRIAGGDTATAEVHLRVRACDPTRGERLITLTELPVRTRFLGLPKTVGTPLATELSVLRRPC
jgi:hypothetical protein